jgi:PAS domain S-box-containing protein
MKKTLEKRIILFSFIVLFMTILANTGMDIYGFRKDYVNALVMRSQSLGTAMKSNVEKVLGLGIDISGMPGLSEKCQDLVASNPEIAYCAITDLDGGIYSLNDPQFRALHFDIASKTSATTQTTQEAHLLGNGTHYFNTITPVKTPDGKLAALIHVGFREGLVTDKVHTMIVRSLLILAVFFLASFSLVVLFVKKSLMQPIATLLNGVKKISNGSFDTPIAEVPIYEINELARNINCMSESLKVRDEEIQKNYKELEGTHQKLRTSYQQLETLSLELEKSEELYKSLMEDSSDAIVVFDGHEKVKMVNKMAEQFFGYSAAELLDLPLTKLLLLLNIENIPRLHKGFKDAQAGQHITEEIHFVRKEGDTVTCKVYASSIRSGGEQMVQTVFRDVTKEMEILRNLSKSAADLVRLNKMKDSFLGLASHELKTPLTVIMGYAELIVTDMADKIDPTVMEMVQNISNAAIRLDSIIKDMVDVSMIDEKRLQLKQEEVNLNRLAEAAVNELRLFFSMRHQEISLQLDETIPTIIGDNLRLIQLLSNVLGNAIKFTPDGGKITVATSAKYLLRGRQDHVADPTANDGGRQQHLYVELTVADTGIGIDRDDQMRIFEKFYEAGNIEEHSSGKVAFKAKGAGLGLAIAKGIVQMHGGEIWVDSPGYNTEHCSGSTFHILLPVKPVARDTALDYISLLR